MDRSKALKSRCRFLLSADFWLGVGLAIYAACLFREGLLLAKGPQDNDWPLLMWLARAGIQGNLDAFAVGHYGFLQLLLVRIGGPLVGGTLNAAKLLNIGSVLVTCVALWVGLRNLAVPSAWRFAAICFFALSYPTFVTSWSEFGDPLALAFFSAGIALLFSSTQGRMLVCAGALVGAAGLVRLHFQTFGWGTGLAFAGLAFARAKRPRAAVETVAFMCGVVAGQLPVFALNLSVHGTLFSPIAKSFMGQVLFGANAYDMANSYAAAPFDGVFSAHGIMLLGVIADRISQMSPAAALILFTGVLSLLRRDDLQSVRAFVILLAIGYYVGFVAPSWGITPRLLNGFMFPVALAVALVGSSAAKLIGPRASIIAAVTFISLTALHFRGERRAVRALRNQTRATWDRNEAITRAIRSRGIEKPVEVFAANWFVYPTDDPEMISYYNFGFWNLLVPEFAAERPNPYVAIESPELFEKLLAENGVRALVLDDDRALPAAQAIVRGSYVLQHYIAIGTFDDQHLYMRRE